MRVFLDEGEDVVRLLYRRMEASASVMCDDELVSPDPLPVLVEPDKGRIAQPVLPVAYIARILKDVLHCQALHVVVVCEIAHIRFIFLFLLRVQLR